MWPFIKDKKTMALLSANPQARPRPMSFDEIVDSMGDCSDLGVHDVAIQFWLPDAAEKSLKQLCALDGNSMSEALRKFLITHCYGTYAFSVMVKKHPDMFKESGPLFSRKQNDDGMPLFSPERENPIDERPSRKRETTYWVCELGKNIAPVKVYIAKRLRDDLKILAEHVDIKLSQYLREIVISRLLGHGTLPVRPEMLSSLPYKAADDWCENEQLPWVQVDFSEYSKAEVREMREVWTDVHE